MKTVLYLFLAVLSVSITCNAQSAVSGVSTDPNTASSQTDPILEALLGAQWPVVVFHVDDVISVQVYGIHDYAVQQQVSSDGTIAFPLVGKVLVQGLSVQELERVLAHSLSAKGMVNDPQVTVTAISRPSLIVTVSGDVAKPGIFPAYANRSLMDYLSEAGGLESELIGNSPVNSPSSTQMTLIRPGFTQPIDIPLGPDVTKSKYGRIPLLPGDEIRVGRVGVIYAFGAFKLQGSFPLKNTSSTTVMELAALAGGIGYEADRKDAHIIRTAGDKRYIVDADVNRILKGEIPDIPLQANDILFVPTNQMKAAIKGGGSSIVVSLAAAYLYSHP